jgi:hypothetical protein
MSEDELPLVESEEGDVMCLRKSYKIPFPRTCPAEGKDECELCSKAIVDKVTEVFGGATYFPCEGTWFNKEDKKVYTDKNLCIEALYDCVPKKKFEELRELVRECLDRTHQYAVLETKGRYPHVIPTGKYPHKR